MDKVSVFGTVDVGSIPAGSTVLITNDYFFEPSWYTYVMRKDKEKAVELRLSGKSYNEIKDILKISKSTLSEWFKVMPESENIRQKLVADRKENDLLVLKKVNNKRSLYLDALYEKARSDAVIEYEIHSKTALFIAGLGLYYGEGNKASKYAVSISNSDYRVLAIFRNFLIRVCNISPGVIKSWLLLYPDLNEEICKEHWINKVHLGRDSFMKSTCIQGRHKTRRVSYGICTIGLGSRVLKNKILVWLDLMAQNMGK